MIPVKASRLMGGALHETIEKLQNSQIERNKYHFLKGKTEAPQSIAGKGLDTILGGLQKTIYHRIDKMAEKPIAPKPAPVIWADEKAQLQSFYHFLLAQTSTEKAFHVCEGICKDADQKIQAILSSTASSGEMQAQQVAVISKLKSSIGQVVFAADRKPSTVSDGTNLEKLDETLDFIKQVAVNEMKETYQQLNALNKAVNAFALQDPDMVFYTEEPKVIAELLLTSTGQLNLGLIGSIKEQFFPHDKNLLEYQQGIVFVLDRMDASWQKALDAVQVPSEKNTASNALVRADLGLEKATVTKLHCQRVILGALLSQLCQGPVGDCFAVSWAIKKHEDFLLGSLEDYIALVQDSCLGRAVNGKIDHFFFETTIADEAMQSVITLNPDGAVEDFNKASFWTCPNLIAACRQMGITDLEKQKDVLLMRIFGTKHEVKKITWDALILECAESITINQDAANELLISGRYGFSLCNNRLLRAWETSLAAMAEARPGDYVRDNISNCCQTVFKRVFDKQGKEIKTPYQKTIVEQVNKTFQDALNASFRLVYNGAIPLTQVSSDGSSSSGGFELYQRDVKDLSNKGIRIATPEQFRTFILGVITETLTDVKVKVQSTADRAVVDSVVKALKKCTNSKDFLRNILYAYDDKNAKNLDPVANYLTLERTPMTSLDGDNPWEVMAIDTGKDFTPDIRTIRPNDPADLLKWLLGIATWKESTQHYLSDGIANEEDTATSPQHAFNIEIEGPEFKDFLMSNLSADAWIKKTLVVSGSHISGAEMSKDAKEHYTKSINDWLPQQFQDKIPKKVTDDVNKLINLLNSKKVTVQQYAERSLDGLSSILHLNADQKRAMSISLDGLFLQALSDEQLNIIQQSSVRFAKTNWDSGPKNLFFCCFFNPRTEKVDFGSIAEDKTGLQPMDQYEWVDKQKWEMDPVLIKK